MSQQHDPSVDFEDSPAARLLDTELDQALDLLTEGIEQLLEIGDRGDLMALGAARLITLAQRVEAHRTRLGALDTALIEAAKNEQLHQHTCDRSLALSLAGVLRISKATARARVARAEQLMPQTTFSTGTTTAQLPALAEAVRTGSISEDQAAVIGTAMAKLHSNPDVGTEDVQTAERILIDQATSLGPDQLRTVAAKIDDVLIPDGTLPSEELSAARRGLIIGPQRRDGTHSITGNLTPAAHARLMSVLTPLAAPQPADELGPDDRTATQRMHDALHDAATRLLDSDGLPRSGGTPATVHLIINADQLTEAATDTQAPSTARVHAVGTTGFGDPISFTDLTALAEQAHIVPTYLSNADGITAYGSSRRIATEGQTQALIARDQGCSFPGCDAPPQWCERHHIIPWYRGGPTDLNNLTLVCGYHHREFDKRGWSVRMHQGRPAWIPPVWIDLEQRPKFNLRIHHMGTAQLNLALDQLDPGDCTSTSSTASCADSRTAKPCAENDLDPIDALTELLGLHINAEEREEFHYELGYLIDSYIGPNAPINNPFDVDSWLANHAHRS